MALERPVSLWFLAFQLRTRNSIRGFVRLSVRPSVCRSVSTSRKVGKQAFQDIFSCGQLQFRPCSPVCNWWPCIRPCFVRLLSPCPLQFPPPLLPLLLPRSLNCRLHRRCSCYTCYCCKCFFFFFAQLYCLYSFRVMASFIYSIPADHPVLSRQEFPRWFIYVDGHAVPL